MVYMYTTFRLLIINIAISETFNAKKQVEKSQSLKNVQIVYRPIIPRKLQLNVLNLWFDPARNRSNIGTTPDMERMLEYNLTTGDGNGQVATKSVNQQ